MRLLSSLPHRLAKDVTYFIGGKKLRSNLMYQVGQLLGCSSQHLLLPASVLELIHTTTIIHDDVLDHTQVRRGNKTMHSIYKKRITIFAADYLISTSLEEFAKHSNTELQALFFRKIKEVCQGEIKQDFNDDFNKPLSIKDCIYIASKKTGALFDIAFATPAVVVGLGETNRNIIEEIGGLYGTIYQLLDDYKDMLFDARTEKNNTFSFKHWTITTVLWNEIDPEHFLRFVHSNTTELSDALRENILDRLFEIIQALIAKTTAKIAKVNDDSVTQCFELVSREINALSPRPWQF